jgi:serine/threonine protein kinase
MAIHDLNDLERYASIRMLEETLGMRSYESNLVMQRLHSSRLPETKIPETVLRQFVPRITKDSLLPIREIGRNETGRVLKSLFCPTLTFVAVKKIMIEDALVRKAVGNEVKILYKIARSCLMDPDLEATIKEDGQYSFMSEQVYNYVYSTGAMATHGASNGESFHGEPANNPYIVKFYSSYIDPSDTSVCVVLEFMNSGSIQSLINNGRKFSEDDAIVIAFAVLNALVDLHGVGMSHRNIKPSNILTNTLGEVKISDFGMSKGKTIVNV